jgi:hypothetical protein
MLVMSHQAPEGLMMGSLMDPEVLMMGSLMDRGEGDRGVMILVVEMVIRNLKYDGNAKK